MYSFPKQIDHNHLITPPNTYTHTPSRTKRGTLARKELSSPEGRWPPPSGLANRSWQRTRQKRDLNCRIVQFEGPRPQVRVLHSRVSSMNVSGSGPRGRWRLEGGPRGSDGLESMLGMLRFSVGDGFRED